MDNYLLISDAAREVKVESHVLRYWEEELHLPIKRNELGHRYYTEEDVERFKQIKGMKERGLQLKAIKMILKDGKLDVLPPDSVQESAAEDQIREEADYRTDMAERTGGLAIDIVPNKSREPEAMQESREDKSRRLQWLLQQLIRETLQENNSELCREIKESVVKELDYQFRMQEEREEARDKLLEERSEEYYQRMDELLRKKAKKRGLRVKAADKGKTGDKAKTGKKNKADDKNKTLDKTEAEIDKEILELAMESIPGDNLFDTKSKDDSAKKAEKKKRHFFF